jgi:hypothetical protein
MVSKSRLILLAASLIALPFGIAVAQQNNPAGNMGSNNSATASPGTADRNPGMNKGPSPRPAARNTNTPGGTGRTVVPGSTSSQAGSAPATTDSKTGAAGGGQK